METKNEPLPLFVMRLDQETISTLEELAQKKQTRPRTLARQLFQAIVSQSAQSA